MWPKSEPARVRPSSPNLNSSGVASFPNLQRDRSATAGFLMVSFGMALSAVTAIVWVMHSLIAANNLQVDARLEGYTLETVVLREKRVKPPKRTTQPPPPVVNELPPMPRMSPTFGPPGTTGIAIPSFGIKELLPPHQKNLVAITHREVMPLAIIQPIYPNRLLERGIEGSCAIFYSISATGVTKDIVVDEADCSHKGFGKAAAKAVSKYKYAPRIVDGEPQNTPNQRQHFQFRIEL